MRRLFPLQILLVLFVCACFSAEVELRDESSGRRSFQSPAESDPTAEKTRLALLVEDENGKPVSGALVLIADGVPNQKPGHDPYFALLSARHQRRVTTAADGKITSPPLYPGAYQVMAFPIGGGLSDAQGRISSAAATAVAVLDKTVAVVLKLRLGGKCAAVVTDQENKPLPGVPLLLSGGGFTRRVVSAAEGKGVFDGLYPGTYAIQPDSTEGPAATGKTQHVTVDEGKSVAVAMKVTQSAALLTYLIHRPKTDGQVAPETTLRLRPTNATVPGGDKTLIVPGGQRAANFRELTPGDYVLTAETKPGWRVEPARSEINVRGGRFARVNLALIEETDATAVDGREGILRIRTLGENKAPVRGIGFSVTSPDGAKKIAETVTAENGLADVKLPVGTYQLRVTQTAGLEVKPESLAVEIKPGETLERDFSALPQADEF